jgi:DNA-binding GntR family transcriptional regulator
MTSASESTTVTRRRQSKLADQLALNIEGLIAAGDLRPGDTLAERSLAERFDVSRSPIRQALKLLQDKGLVATREDGGYTVATAVRLPVLELPPPSSVDESEPAYLKIAEDRLEGRLPDKVSESDLMRRYDLTKAQLGAILQRIVHEGWIERSPGHGWRFLPILTSPETYDQGYRFRILIESAALMEPGFRVDEAALRKCLAEQQELIDGAVEWASPAQLFDANTRLHETIAGFSGNVFILESLKRINRLRRLMEYKKVVDREAAARRCKEHKVLIELLLNGQREAATDFIRLHLRDAAREKSAS